MVSERGEVGTGLLLAGAADVPQHGRTTVSEKEGVGVSSGPDPSSDLDPSLCPGPSLDPGPSLCPGPSSGPAPSSCPGPGALERSSLGLLEQARLAWIGGREDWRDAKLQTGRLLLHFLTNRMEVADHLPEAKRGEYGRSQSIRMAAAHLGIRAETVNDLMRVSSVVDILSDNGYLGSMAYTTLQHFRKGIHRRKGPRSRGPSSTGLSPSEKVGWELVSESYRTLFRRAVQEGWTDGQVRKELGRCRKKGNTGQMGREEREWIALDTHGYEEPTLIPDLSEMVRTASPRDAAEKLLPMILRSGNPLLLVDHLSRLVRSHNPLLV